ncbi:MAG: bifunctional riboflavin kinase/FAD synthetase [Firmicutes bacterium]|nr:bifunctional riboflavin kinase/FAD synthetase [Bacillota bacterium]
MITFDNLAEINAMEPTALALGNFDGVHLGHQALIGAMVEKAHEKGTKAAVFTFSNHPRNLLPGRTPVLNITMEGQKSQIIESLGVDYLFNIEFTEEIMTMEPESFIRELLVGRLNAKDVFCGFNYNYGFKAKGNTQLLKKMGAELGFDVWEMPPFYIEDDVVSSSLIRTLIASGQVEKCETYLGRNYAIDGEVVVGNRLGRKLGFPTSNLVISPNMVTPPNGVYVTYCTYNGHRYPSVTNVGHKPTIGEYEKNVETHIFNFDKELYGKHISVEFLEKTRDEVKFDNIEELSEQILRDCRDARKYHEKLLNNK